MNTQIYALFFEVLERTDEEETRRLLKYRNQKVPFLRYEEWISRKLHLYYMYDPTFNQSSDHEHQDIDAHRHFIKFYNPFNLLELLLSSSSWSSKTRQLTKQKTTDFLVSNNINSYPNNNDSRNNDSINNDNNNETLRKETPQKFPSKEPKCPPRVVFLHLLAIWLVIKSLCLCFFCCKRSRLLNRTYPKLLPNSNHTETCARKEDLIQPAAELLEEFQWYDHYAYLFGSPIKQMTDCGAFCLLALCLVTITCYLGILIDRTGALISWQSFYAEPLRERRRFDYITKRLIDFYYTLCDTYFKPQESDCHEEIECCPVVCNQRYSVGGSETITSQRQTLAGSVSGHGRASVHNLFMVGNRKWDCPQHKHTSQTITEIDSYLTLTSKQQATVQEHDTSSCNPMTHHYYSKHQANWHQRAPPARRRVSIAAHGQNLHGSQLASQMIPIDDVTRYYVSTESKTTACSCHSIYNKERRVFLQHLKTKHLVKLARPAIVSSEAYQDLKRLILVTSLTHWIYAFALAFCIGSVALKVELSSRVQNRFELQKCQLWHPNGTLIRDHLRQPRLSDRQKISLYERYPQQLPGKFQWDWYQMLLYELQLYFNVPLVITALELTFFFALITVWIFTHLNTYTIYCRYLLIWLDQQDRQMQCCLDQLKRLQIKLEQFSTRLHVEFDVQPHLGSLDLQSEAEIDSLRDQIDMVKKTLTISYLNFESFRNEYRAFTQTTGYILYHVYPTTVTNSIICYVIITTINRDDVYYVWFLNLAQIAVFNILNSQSLGVISRIEIIYQNIREILIVGSPIKVISNSVIFELWRRQALNKDQVSQRYTIPILGVAMPLSSIMKIDSFFATLWLFMAHSLGYL